jgi:hypothetical protein
MLDKFSKTFDKFNRDMSKGASASKAFSNALGGIGVGLSVAGVAAFGMSSVKAYGDALTAQQRLMDAFSKQPQLMGYNVQALMEYNKTLSTKIAYDDDEINAAQANLALFKLTGDQIKSLTPLVADLARRKGIDLASAATSVGKAMQGQARGLKDLGINFKATGDTAADYAAITALLNQQVGGTAEAFAQGNPLGQLANAKIAFQNMQESVGQALLPAMTALTNIMTPLATAMSKIPQPVMQIGIVIGAAILGARLLGPAMSGAFAQMRASALSASASVAASGVVIQGTGLRAAASGVMMRGFAASAAVAGTAARGLMTALGGPIGIAIIGITTAISLFAMRSGEAEAATDGWTESIERQNGVLTENSKLNIVKKLQDDGVLTALQSTTTSAEDYTKALISGGDARNKMIDDLQAMADYYKKQAETGAVPNAQDQADKYQLVADKLATLGQNLDDNNTTTTIANNVAASLGISVAKVGDATAMTTAEIVAMNAALKTQIATNNVLSPALAKTIALLYAPKRDVAGGETVEHALKRFTDYMVLMGLAADTTAPAVDNVTESVTKLSDPAQKALDKANALGEALKSITAERDGFVASINDASLSFTSIFGFDIKGGVAASQAVTDALQRQAEARAALAAIGPGDDDARAKAQQDLAAATRDVAAAEMTSLAAQPTGANVLNSYKGRLAKLQRFSRVMASLAKKGLSALIYQDILGQGIDGGLEMAQAINGDKALIGDLNKTADSIARSTSGMAARAGNYVYGGYVNDAQRRADRGANAATALGATPDAINVTLKLDSATVYKQLLRLKRERGGQSLGV